MQDVTCFPSSSKKKAGLVCRKYCMQLKAPALFLYNACLPFSRRVTFQELSEKKMC